MPDDQSKKRLRPRILAVDDDPKILDSLASILGEKFDIITANDEDSGLQKARDLHPDLILLDIGLGTDSGINLCYSLRNAPETRNIPVVMLTGYHDKSIWDLAQTAGADDYLEKSMDPHELISRLESKLGPASRAS